MKYLAAYLIGLASGGIGAIAAGGGLISVPGLIFLGLSPVSAIATTRLNVVGGGLSAAFRYQKSGAVRWENIFRYLILALVAGVVGPKLLLSIDPDIVERTIGIIFLVTLPFLLYNKQFGVASQSRSANRRLVGFLALLAVLTYATMFGAGGGIFLIYVFVYFFGMTVTEANATGFLISSIATLIAVITYAHDGAVDWAIGIPCMIGAMTGAYLGAHLAIKKGTVWVKAILSVVVVASSIKLIFF